MFLDKVKRTNYLLVLPPFPTYKKVCSRWLLCTYMLIENLYMWKNNYWIELKTLWLKGFQKWSAADALKHVCKWARVKSSFAAMCHFKKKKGFLLQIHQSTLILKLKWFILEYSLIDFNCPLVNFLKI